jgi:hypothetical protein
MKKILTFTLSFITLLTFASTSAFAGTITQADNSQWCDAGETDTYFCLYKSNASKNPAGLSKREKNTRNSYGSDVLRWKQWLFDNKYLAEAPTDDKFDLETKKATTAFQKANKIKKAQAGSLDSFTRFAANSIIDGTADPVTPDDSEADAPVLDDPITPVKNPNNQPSDDEEDGGTLPSDDEESSAINTNSGSGNVNTNNTSGTLPDEF